MRNNMLLPLKRNSDDAEGPADKMRCRLERHTKYWPITISNTLMYNLKQVNNQSKLYFNRQEEIFFILIMQIVFLGRRPSTRINFKRYADQRRNFQVQTNNI